MNKTLADLCAAYGVIWQYLDGAGKSKQAPEESCIAILNAMGLEIRTQADIAEHLRRFKARENKRLLPDYLVVEADLPFHVPMSGKTKRNWHLLQEDTTELRGISNEGGLTLPPLPLGVHSLRCGDDICTVLSAPAQLTPPTRGWGLMAPLYGLKSGSDCGFGDFRDLSEMATTLAPLGADFIGVNPVHAGFPGDPNACSPYSPSSRQQLNPLHINLDVLAQGSKFKKTVLSSASSSALIDYPALKTQKADQLEAAFEAFESDGDTAEFDKFVRDGSKALKDFATHQALSEIHGPYWHLWPKPLQSPASPETKLFSADNKHRVRFHGWLQWCAHNQLKQAQQDAVASGMTLGLYLDLAVGTHPYGAETWADDGAFAHGVSLGAPSDSFDASGQNWQLVPFNPLEVKARQFKPLIDTLRSQLTHAGLLRIDHILGFERSFWIPEGLPGAYVSLPRDALFAIIRIEATRAGASIIGEDLGNVPNGLRDALIESGVLGCRVAFFERNWKNDKSFTAAENYTALSLASITTHDLPTLLGWIKGRDIDWRQRIEEISSQQAMEQQKDRKEDIRQFKKALSLHGIKSQKVALPLKSNQQVVLAAYRFLADTSSALVAVQVEDVLQLVEQPNLPGTIDSHPNWRRRLEKTTKEIAGLAVMKQISKAMTNAGRGRN